MSDEMGTVTELSPDGRFVKIDDPFWSYYIDRKAAPGLDERRCGKWMAFFSGLPRAEEVCAKAVLSGAVAECKHTSAPIVRAGKTGVMCFYLNGDDRVAHRRVLSFMIENGLIRKTKTGRLFNIAFKYDDQTRAGEYGGGFKAKMTLSDLVDLDTGEFLD